VATASDPSHGKEEFANIRVLTTFLGWMISPTHLFSRRLPEVGSANLFRLRATFQELSYIVSNRFGSGSTKVSFGVFCGAWTGGLLPFLMGSQDERVDGGENLPLALGCGIRPSAVGDADPAHVVTFVTLLQPIGRLECRAAPPTCISVELNS